MRILSYLLFLMVFSFNVSSQEKHTVSGYISDANSGESIIGASVYTDQGRGVTTNTYGFYSLTLSEGDHNIYFSFIGYDKQVKQVNLKNNITHNVELKVTSVSVDEIEVRGERSIVETTETSVIDVPIQQIKSIPALLGEVDVLKAIQLLPGVQSSEGTSGFYVRGGGPDQNLILLDGVPVYNASHLGGLFSVFNADAINSVRLTKGGFPARFGVRLSSVLQIDMKEGNMKKFQGTATVGAISSKFAFEGPIIKDRTSFIVSARRTYADLFVKPFLDNNIDLTLYFYDLNAKINHKISNKDRIYLSAYMGDDIFNIDFTESEGSLNPKNGTESTRVRLGLDWGNLTSMIRWNHLFNSKLFSNTTLTYSEYGFNRFLDFQHNQPNAVSGTMTGESHEHIYYGYISGIQDLGARVDFDYLPTPDHDIKFGMSYTHHHFYPGETKLNIDILDLDTSNSFSIDTTLNFSPRVNAHEAFFYVEDDVRISNRLKANLGLHIGFYAVEDSLALNSVEDLLNVDFLNFQPRLSFRYLLNDEWSVKASYSAMRQNIHLLSNSSVGLPTDIWVPAIDSVPSQYSQQIAASLSTELYAGLYELSLETYYKTMNNLITYKEGYSNLLNTEAWEESIETGGEGRSYGAELFLQRKRGGLTGWIGYTLSWSERRFDHVNFGEWYPYKYDRRHDVSVVTAYKVSDGFDVGLTWVYGTGNAITFPRSVYLGLPSRDFIEIVESYGDKNSVRMPPYHRLDLSMNFRKVTPNYTRTWSFGTYNTYNRLNPFFIYLTEVNNERVARQVSLFPIIPFVSYNITF